MRVTVRFSPISYAISLVRDDIPYGIWRHKCDAFFVSFDDAVVNDAPPGVLLIVFDILAFSGRKVIDLFFVSGTGWI